MSIKFNTNISKTGCEILDLRRLPARIDAKQAAAILGFQEHDIAVLTAMKMLKPLGKPVQNATKYFASCEIEALALNQEWLAKATQIIYERWRLKNKFKADKPREKEEVLEVGDSVEEYNAVLA